MPSTDPPPNEAIGQLLKQAVATVYCRPALRALGEALPSDEDDTNPICIEWERQPLRIPEYTGAFQDSVRDHPRQASAAAIAAVGRLAAGDPSIWKTVRALKRRPGTLRVRIAGDYRLLFETGPADSLRILDFILRRDLDRWLSAGG